MDTLVSMQTFRRVAELGSFVAASKRMNLSTAMTSKHVMALEERLGVRLLNRTSRKVSLTEAGSAYLVQLVQTLDALEEAELSITQNTSAPKGLLRFSAPVWAASQGFMAMLTDFTHQYPQINLDVDLTGRLVDVVEEGFDLALRVSDSPGDQFIARPVAKVCFYWVASPGYLARVGALDDTTDIMQHSFLWYSGLPDITKTMQTFSNNEFQKLRSKASDITPKLITGNESLLREAALAGMGIAILPSWMIESDLQDKQLIKLFDDGFTIELKAVYASRKYLSSKVRLFIDHAIEHYRNVEPK